MVEAICLRGMTLDFYGHRNPEAGQFEAQPHRARSTKQINDR